MLDSKCTASFPFHSPIDSSSSTIGVLSGAGISRENGFRVSNRSHGRLKPQLTTRLCHPDEVITTASNCTAGIGAAVNPVLMRAPFRFAVYPRVLFFKISDVA
jgi:hypothetical protein